MGIDNPVHLIFLAAVALLVLGPKRLPEVARSVGKGIRDFREAMSDGSATGFMHEHHNGVPGGGVPVGTPVSGMTQPPDAEVVADHGSTSPAGGGWGALHTGAESTSLAGSAGQVDPVEPVRSGDAPDRRPL